VLDFIFLEFVSKLSLIFGWDFAFLDQVRDIAFHDVHHIFFEVFLLLSLGGDSGFEFGHAIKVGDVIIEVAGYFNVVDNFLHVNIINGL